MRFRNERVSPAKRNVSPHRIEGRGVMNCKLKSDRQYMHYNNAIYMGGMTSFKRNGVGLMLWDDGTSAVIDSCFDSLTSHSLFFRESTIVSLLHLRKGSFEVALRTEHLILKLPFYDCEDLPNGNGLLIDYKELKLYHLFFQTGRVTKKIAESNKEVLLKVWDYNLKGLLDSRHERSFKLNIKLGNDITILKKNNKVLIGYFDRFSNLEGLGMKLCVDSATYDRFEEDLVLKCSERGHYQQGRLENYGERYFTNGNYYIGQFEDDRFSGKGLMMYPEEAEGKWVYGEFEQDKLVKMIDMSLGDEDSPSPRAGPKHFLKRIHEANFRNWMGNRIESLDWDLLFSQLEEVLHYAVTDVVVEKEKVVREEEERLQQIQYHFSRGHQSQEIDRVLIAQKELGSLVSESILINEYSSLKPKALRIEPRTVENEDLWASTIPSLLTSSKMTPSQKKFNLRTFAGSR
jgi:hypothetical protein